MSSRKIPLQWIENEHLNLEKRPKKISTQISYIPIHGLKPSIHCCKVKSRERFRAQTNSHICFENLMMSINDNWKLGMLIICSIIVKIPLPSNDASNFLDNDFDSEDERFKIWTWRLFSNFPQFAICNYWLFFFCKMMRLFKTCQNTVLLDAQ